MPTRRPITLACVLIGIAVMAWLLLPASAPFLCGLMVAYALHPICKRLEQLGLSSGATASIVIGGAFAAAILAAVLLVPFLFQQATALLIALPSLQHQAVARLQPYWTLLKPYLDQQTLSGVEDAAKSSVGTVANTIEAVLRGVLASGSAVVDLVTFVIFVPVVAYYCLRDWESMVSSLDRHLPLRLAPFVREQAALINATLSAWLRGQSVSCLILASFYAVGLTLCGLRYGLLIGLFTGLCAMVPFLGYGLGLTAGILSALFTFPDWHGWAATAVVFVIGNILEGYVLTPRLVGRSVGLNEVWVMFALVAFGHILGFVGVVFAVPAAAVVGVLTRTASQHYLRSRWFSEWSGPWEERSQPHGGIRPELDKPATPS